MTAPPKVIKITLLEWNMQYIICIFEILVLKKKKTKITMSFNHFFNFQMNNSFRKSQNESTDWKSAIFKPSGFVNPS